MIPAVKGFGVVNKAEVDVFLEFSCFFNNPTDVGNLASGSSAFSKSSLNIWKFFVHLLLKLTWRILSITSLACKISAIVQWFEHSLWNENEMKTTLFQSCSHCWLFQICWHIKCSTFIVSSFRTWKSSVRIPPPPLALSVVMILKAHLTLDSRMSGSRWVITPSWLSVLSWFFFF